MLNTYNKPDLTANHDGTFDMSTLLDNALKGKNAPNNLSPELSAQLGLDPETGEPTAHSAVFSTSQAFIDGRGPEGRAALEHAGYDASNNRARISRDHEDDAHHRRQRDAAHTFHTVAAISTASLVQGVASYNEMAARRYMDMYLDMDLRAEMISVQEEMSEEHMETLANDLGIPMHKLRTGDEGLMHDNMSSAHDAISMQVLALYNDHNGNLEAMMASDGYAEIQAETQELKNEREELLQNKSELLPPSSSGTFNQTASAASILDQNNQNVTAGTMTLDAFQPAAEAHISTPSLSPPDLTNQPVMDTKLPDPAMELAM